MIQALNANAVKLKKQRGRLSGFATALDGHKMAVGNERLANQLHWVEGDQLQSEAGDTVRAMRTRDSLDVANNLQRKLRPIDVPAQLFPEDKVELLKQLKAASLTGMVVDGINDAPTLAVADVGIAMGVAGTAIAMETVDIALMTNDLQKLAVAVRLGQKSRRKILQNIVLSVTTNVLVIVLAAGGYASLWGAVLADVGTCLLVIFNGMLLVERKKDESRCLGLFAFRWKCRSKVCQKDDLLSSEKYVDLEAEPWCPKKMEDNRVSAHGTKQEYCVSYCATKSCCDVRGANNGMRQRVNNRDACENNCQCIAIDEGLLVSSDAANVGSEVRDSLLGGNSESDVESVRYQELASYALAHGIFRSQDFSSKEGRHVEVESAPIRHLDKHEDEQDMILQYYSEVCKPKTEARHGQWLCASQLMDPLIEQRSTLKAQVEVAALILSNGKKLHDELHEGLGLEKGQGLGPGPRKS
ncbi:hypothetical protein L7F22_008995 [Adiantum nelumboides]|nr:hypothetical protein [Adiantum nelumboides]